jgi:hypothetical protein
LIAKSRLAEPLPTSPSGGDKVASPLGGQTLANRKLGDRRKCIGRTNLAGIELAGAKDIPSVSATAGLRPARARVFRQNAAGCRVARRAPRIFADEIVSPEKSSCERQAARPGFATLVHNAETDESLAEKIGLRLDLPLRLLRDLLIKATEAVRSRILSLASPETRDKIQHVLAKTLNEVSREASAPRDFTLARQSIRSMQEQGKLNEAAVLEFATTRRYEEMVAAVAALCSAPIELIASLMRSDRNDGLLIPCKAAGLKWPTVCAILKNRFAHHSISEYDLAHAKGEFLRFSQASAQRVLRFWQVRSAGVGVAR